jgi:hypothetical protein
MISSHDIDPGLFPPELLIIIDFTTTLTTITELKQICLSQPHTPYSILVYSSKRREDVELWPSELYGIMISYESSTK